MSGYFGSESFRGAFSGSYAGAVGDSIEIERFSLREVLNP